MRLQTVGRIVIVGLALLLAPLATEAQQPRKVPHIGFIEATSAVSGRQLLDAFRQGLRALGYVEGGNILIEDRWAEEQPDRFPDLLAELIRLRVDVLVVGSVPGARAAQQATSTIPVVFAAVGDPVGLGLVASFGRPGGNMTGVSLAMEGGFAGKWVELLKETVPQVSRIAALWNPMSPVTASNIEELQRVVPALGIALQSLAVRDRNALDHALNAIVAERAGALIVTGSPLFFSHRTWIVEVTAKHRIPAMFFSREFVAAGGLMAYGPSIPDSFRRAAYYVDKILKGAMPADLPVEQPMKFELVINLKTAKALGITIPPSLLLLADEVIQ